ALVLGRAEAHRSNIAEGAGGPPCWSDCRARSWTVPSGFGGVSGTPSMLTHPPLTGPVTGGRRGWPFSLPLTDLASVGYVAEEFFLDGTAAAYEAEPGTGLTVEGEWRVRPWRRAPFRTGVLVCVSVGGA